MIDTVPLPEGCVPTVEHALIHLNSAVEAAKDGDLDQLLHDLYIAHAVIGNVIVIYRDQPND